MIAFGAAVASETTYRARAVPGIRRVAEPDSLVLAPAEHGSLQVAYNRILDEAGGHRELEALVLLHEDVEIVDREFMSKLRCRVSEEDVAVVGVVGALAALASPQCHRRRHRTVVSDPAGRSGLAVG